MKRIMTFGLVGIAAGTVVTVAISAEGEGLDNWRNAISTNDFKKTLVSVKSLQEDWPAVHSVKHKENKDEAKALVQTGYRDVARDFLQGLERYEKKMRDMPPEAFCEGADALLEARGRFLKHPSYINYFLADCINRVIYVNLGERLAMVGDVPTCYDRLVERLADFRCDWSLAFDFVTGECDASQISAAEFNGLSLEKKIDEIGKMIGQEQTFLIYPQDYHNLFGVRILEKRSLTTILARLAMSDHVIGAFLPAWLSYRRKTEHFAQTDSRDQIRAVLGGESLLPPTLLQSTPPFAAVEASKFLRGVKSENWRHTLFFSDPPTFTKEVIEQFEREEAEREAEQK